MAAKNKKPSLQVGEMQIPLHFNLPIGMPSVYATNFIVQATDHEVVISFYEAQPPMVIEGDEESIELLKKVGVRADCVTKVTISRARFDVFAGVVNGFAERLKETEQK